MGLFIVPLVLIELPFILPELLWGYFKDSVSFIFEVIKGDFKFE